MDPTLLSRVPGGPRDLVCLHIGGLPTTAVVSWPRGHVTSGGEVWELCESHPICVVPIMCTGRPAPHRPTHKGKEKGMNACEFHLCLGMNTLWYSPIQACACLPLYPFKVHPPWGSWRLLRWAAAAESLQSCPTLCDPIDGSPPGSPVPGILQARTLEWVAISLSNA